MQGKSYLPDYYSMRDLNEDSNSFGWPFYCGDKSLTNGPYYNSYVPRAVSEAYSGYDKDAVKQKMLEHEAIFKDQVCIQISSFIYQFFTQTGNHYPLS